MVSLSTTLKLGRGSDHNNEPLYRLRETIQAKSAPK